MQSTIPEIILTDTESENNLNPNSNENHDLDITCSQVSLEIISDTDEHSCKICDLPATYPRKRTARNTLYCHKCNKLTHFKCASLPKYVLYDLTTSSKRYTCEYCVNTPGSFLQSITWGSSSSTVGIHTNLTELLQKEENRLQIMEGRVENLCDIL